MLYAYPSMADRVFPWPQAVAPMPAVAVAMLSGAISALVAQYISTVLWVAPFIGARGLVPPVERSLPALIVCLYPAMFGIALKMGLGSALLVSVNTP